MSKNRSEVFKKGRDSWNAYASGQNVERWNLDGGDYRELSDLSGFIFKAPTSFVGARFSTLNLPTEASAQSLDISSVTVEGQTYFSLGQRTEVVVKVHNATFLGDVVISGNYGALDWCDSSVAGSLTLSGTFVSPISVAGEKTVIRGGLRLDGAKIQKEADFSGITVGSDRDGTNERSSPTLFSAKHTEFGGPAYLREIKLRGGASFIGSTFGDRTDFRGTVFGGPPAFHGAKLNQETEFDPVDQFDLQFPNTTSEGAEHRYRTLKHLMISSNALGEQLGFARLEMKAHTRKLPWLNLHRFYGWIADFGISWVRPLAWLALVTLAFWAAFSALAGVKSLTTALPLLNLSLSNSFPFVGAFKALGVDEVVRSLLGEHQITVALLSLAQSVVSAILLFLTALGIRNRLRMK